MAIRGTFYRCNLFSWGDPQTEGVTSQWTQSLQPVGDREILSGELVEMMVTIANGSRNLNSNSKIRFDILEEDFALTFNLDDRVISYLGTGVQQPEDPFPTERRNTLFHSLESNETLEGFVEQFKNSHPSNFIDHILIVAERRDAGPFFTVLSWWVAQADPEDPGTHSEFYFIVNVDGSFEDQSEKTIEVSMKSVTDAVAGYVANIVFRGRILDNIDQPVRHANVIAQRFSGVILGQDVSDGNGRFGLEVPFHPELQLIIRVGEASRIIPKFLTPDEARQPQDLGDIHIGLFVTLADSVGDGGVNNPIDIRRVQDRLQYLGRLNNADVAAEPINVGAAPPVAEAAIPRLISSIYAHNRSWFCYRRPRIPNLDFALRIINTEPFWPLSRIALADPVGGGAGAVNNRGEVRVVQERLYQLGFLLAANYLAERVDPAAGPPQVPEATIPQTIQAIRKFEASVVGGHLKQIVPGRSDERLMNDPYPFGIIPIQIRGSVGTGSENRPVDVRAIQDRLLLLGFISPANHTAEAADPNNLDPIPEGNLVHTIAAIVSFRQTELLVPPPAQGQIKPFDDSIARLNTPSRVDLQDSVGQGGHNDPRDVRTIQDRLYVLGFLGDAAYSAERVNPAGRGVVAVNRIQQTIAAIVTFQERVPGRARPAAGILAPPPVGAHPSDRPAIIDLSNNVGAGGANISRDVRKIQDRLHQLGFLADNNYQTERTDPDETGAIPETNIPLTLGAIGRLRQQVLHYPAGQPALVRPGDEAHRLLNDPLFFGRIPITLSGSVGSLGWNHAADVRAVQDRLREIGLLNETDFATEAVNPLLPNPIADNDIARTRAAIARFSEQFLGVPVPGIDRIEATSAELRRLNNPLHFLSSRIDLNSSVGQGGANSPADVRSIQHRLYNLRFLSENDYRTELVDPAAPGPIADANIPQTIRAIALWREHVVHAAPPPPVLGIIEPLDVTLRLLSKPFLPPPSNIQITNSVGAGANNQESNVRRIQDRLHFLGILETADYLRERVNPAGGGNVGDGTIPQTIQSIHHFQRTASGGTDGRVDAGGMTLRVMNDPTFATLTFINPHTSYRHAGPPMPAFAHEVQQIILAIEAHEAGMSTGEVPAILRNGSQTPASFGKGQLIGGTALGTLDGNPAFAAFYDLTPADTNVLQVIVANTLNRYNNVFNAVPLAAVTEVQLQVLIQNYVTANLLAFHTQTGLGRSDITNMFRTAQLRRHIRNHINAQPVPPGTPPGDVNAVRRAQAVININNLLANADVTANINALSLTRNDVIAYVRRAIDGEHRAGFVTRALFYSSYGQVLRNAMTDDSGFKIGRFLIRDNFNMVVNAATAAGAVLNTQQRAQITARIHNSGPAGLNNFVNNPANAVNAYVNNVMAHWVP